MLKRFNISSPSLRGLRAVCVDRGRRKNGGDTRLQLGQRTEIHFKSGGKNQAMGGARPARCREKESLGAACCGSEVYQGTISGGLGGSSPAAASPGMVTAC